MALCSEPHDRSPQEGFPQRPAQAPCCEHRGPVCRISSCHRYRCHPAQPTPEGCSGYLGPPWPCGSYDTNSRRWDRRYPDHAGVGEQKSPCSGGHQIDGPEPVPQRLSSCVEDGIGGHCGLMQTTPALIFSSRGDEPGPIMVAVGTTKPIRPFTLDDISQTVALGAETTSELSRGHGFIQSSPPLWPSYRSVYDTTEVVLNSIN